jgi:hypothetical protein
MDVRMPDGTIVTNVPDNITQEDLLSAYSSYTPEPVRENPIYGVAANITPSLATGIGSLLQTPGKLADLITGTAPGEKAGIGRTLLGAIIPGGAKTVQEAGVSLEEIGRQAKTLGLQQKEKERAEKVEQGEGQVSKFGTALAETITDPTLLSSFLFEQIPNTVGSWGFGLLGKAGFKALVAGASEQAAARAGLATAVGSGVAMQGTDVGYNTYKDIYERLIKEGMSPVEANTIASQKGVVAGLEGGALSYAASRIPGARELEKIAFRKASAPTGALGKAAIIKGGARGAAGETLGENIEEIGGQFASNIGKQEVFPETSLTGGLGEAGAMATIGGSTLGGGAGALNARAEGRAQQRLTEEAAIAEANAKRNAAVNEALKGLSETEDITTVQSPVPLNDPSLEFSASTEINGVKTYTYIKRTPKEVAVQPEPELFGSREPLPQDILDQGYKLVEQREEDGQPLYVYVKEEPVTEIAAPVAAPIAIPAAPELALGAPPESAEQRALPPVAQPAQIAQAGIVQPNLAEQPIAEPVSAAPAQVAQPALDPNVQAQLAAEAPDVEAMVPNEPPPVAPKRVPKAVAPKAGEKILSAHEFIASLGGLDKKEAAEIDKDAAKSNVRIGNKWLYASKGGLTASQAAEKLAEAGYIQVEDNNEVYRVINDSLIDPVYSINDADAIAERKFAEQAAEEAARFAEKEAAAGVEAQEVSAEVAAEQAVEAADLGNFRQQMLDAGYTEQDLNVIGFTKASPELQAEVAALEKQVSEAGLDPSEILEVLSKTYGDQLITKQEYYAKAKSELAKAIREKAVQGGSRDVSQADVQEGAAREEGLTSPSEQELRDQQEAADQADAAKAKADRDAAAKEKAEQDRKDIAARSEKAAGEYELGKTAEEDLSGQKDIFSNPVQISPKQQKIDALNKFEERLSNTVPPFRGAGAAGAFFYTPKPLSDKQIALIKDLASEAIDLGMPASLLEDISASGATRMNAVAAIASKRGWLVLGGQWSSASRTEKLQAIIHELGHSVDNTKERISDGDVWKKAHDELKKWHDSSNTPREHPLAYPFNKQFSGKLNLNRESFAQAFSLYFVSPVELQTNAPEAYSQIQSIVEGIQNESQRTGAASATKTSAAEVKVQQPRTQKGATVQSEVGEVGSGVSQAERSKDRDEQRIEDEAGQDRQKDVQKIAEKADVPPILQAPADFVLKEGRIEQVALAARALSAGKITKAEYDRYVDFYAPISTIANPEAPLSDAGMVRVLKSDQVNKINPDIKDGTRVGIRMDINALKRARALSKKTGENVVGSVVSIHKGSNINTQGEIIGYSAAASIKNAKFAIRSEKESIKVAQSIKDKSPQQTIEGEWVNISPEDAYARIKSLLKDPKWAQVSLDPLRHSFFYDRSNKRPVVSADEILQVGRFVLAKNVKYAEREEFLYSIAPLANAPTVPSIGTPRMNITGAPIAGTWSAAPETTLTPWIYKIQDKQIDLKDAQKQIEKTVGKIDDALNAYRKETLYYGRVADQTERFLNEELKPLLKDMINKKISLDTVDKYLQALHAPERNASIAKRVGGMPDGGAGISTADAQAYLASLSPQEKADLQDVSDRVRKIISGTQEIEVSGGLELQSKIDGWNKAWPNYVPLFRDEVDYVNSGSGMGQGFSTRGGSSKRAIGSDKPVKEIIASLAEQRQKAIVRSEKARVGRALYALAIANPNPDYWLPIDPKSKEDIKLVEQMLTDYGFDPGDIAQLIKNMAQEPRTGSVKRVFNPVTKQFDEVVKYDINTQNRYSSNVLPVRINGEDKFLFFNPSNDRAKRMAESIKNLDAEQLGEVTQIVGSVTRFIAALSTQYNPIFGAWNFARDVQGAMLNLSTTPLRDKKAEVASGAFKAMRGIYKEVRARRAGGQSSGYYSDLYRDFESVGGKTGFINQFNKLDKKGSVVERELKGLTQGRIKGAAAAVGGWLSDYNDVLENAVRLSAYEQGLAKGLSKEEAAEIAKNLTVNFNRKGAKTAGLGALYAFFNSAVQGTARLYETLRGPAGKKIIAGGFLLGAFQAALLAMAGFDEDEPSEFIKQKNFVIPLLGGGYAMIPMPLGFNVLPNIGRIVSEIAFGDKKSGSRKVADLLESVVSSFNPLGSGNAVQMIVPTVLDPIANVIMNRDSFGRPISREDRAMNPSPGYLRSRESAGVISKGIAEFLNLVSGGSEFNKGAFSPTGDDINYVVGQYLGGVGREVMRAKEFVTSIGKEEPFEPYKVPILGKIYGDINAPASVANKFYLNVKQMAEHENEIKGRKGSGVSEYLRDNPDARLYRSANRLENEISKLNKTKTELLKRDAPEERIRRIEDQKLRMMKQFNDQVRKLQ